MFCNNKIYLDRVCNLKYELKASLSVFKYTWQNQDP